MKLRLARSRIGLSLLSLGGLELQRLISQSNLKSIDLGLSYIAALLSSIVLH